MEKHKHRGRDQSTSKVRTKIGGENKRWWEAWGLGEMYICIWFGCTGVGGGGSSTESHRNGDGRIWVSTFGRGEREVRQVGFRKFPHNLVVDNCGGPTLHVADGFVSLDSPHAHEKSFRLAVEKNINKIINICKN